MYQTKRFGLVASKQEYMMLCRADRHMKQKKKLTGQRLPAFKGDESFEQRRIQIPYYSFFGRWPVRCVL
jgi:hypothetical protein